jgi:hypothetical protein
VVDDFDWVHLDSGAVSDHLIICAYTTREQIEFIFAVEMLMGLGTIAYGVYLAHQYVRDAIAHISWFAVSNKLVTELIVSSSRYPLPLWFAVCPILFRKASYTVGAQVKI